MSIYALLATILITGAVGVIIGAALGYMTALDDTARRAAAARRCDCAGVVVVASPRRAPVVTHVPYVGDRVDPELFDYDDRPAQ